MQKFGSHEQMKEFVEKERKRLEERKNKVRDIVSNSYYINWLEEFTLKYPNIWTNEFINNKKISIKDKENLNNMMFFFEAIYNYAHDNFIYPINDLDYNNCYRIKYNNIGYEIGVMSDQRMLFYCKRYDNIDDTFIDFNYIMLNKKQDNTDYIEKRLIELSNIITYFYEQNIPLQAIKSTINDTIFDIEENSKQKNKMFRKIK